MAAQEQLWHRHYDEGVPASLELEPATIPQLFGQSVERFGHRPAMIFFNRRLTFSQLKVEVDRCATALAGLGVERDSRVAIHLPNLPQTVISCLATLSLGAQAVMTNPLYVGREIVHQWNDAGCTVAVTADFLFDQKLKDLRDELPVRDYLIASIPEYLSFPLNLLAPLKLKKMDPPTIAKVEPGPGIHFFGPLLKRAGTPPPRVEFGPDHLALLQYTGGTTGAAKGAMLTHANLAANARQLIAWFPRARPGQETLLAALPFFHIFGLTVALLWSLLAGAATVLVPNPRDLPALVKAIAKHKVTLFPGVPAMFNALNNHPGIEKYDLTSLTSCFSGAAPLPVEVQERFEQLTGARLVEGYGLTESSPVTHVNPIHGARKPGTIGLPLPDTLARVVDPQTGQGELPPGQEGELVVKGPQVMAGYWQREAETAEMLKEGWLYTGDLALVDEEGYFSIVGRKKDMILASGYNIYPDEIDGVLMEHPAVLEACTIGVPDAKRGETVKSFVVLKPGAQTATAAQLKAHCQANLAAYKVPREYEFRDELPKSAVQKLLRRVLREEELTKQSEEKAA